MTVVRVRIGRVSIGSKGADEQGCTCGRGPGAEGLAQQPGEAAAEWDGAVHDLGVGACGAGELIAGNRRLSQGERVGVCCVPGSVEARF